LNSAALVSGATPAATSGLRLRLGGLRSQMWFIPRESGGLGDAQRWNNPTALALPVTNGLHAAPAGTEVTAVPYDPGTHALPDSDTTCPSNYSFSVAKGLCTRNGHADRAPTAYGRNAIYALSMRVKVCDGTLDTRDICTAYSAGRKPEGLLQRNAKKTRYSLFSYLTESGESRNGGVMRARQKLIGPVTAAEQNGLEKPYPDRNGRIAGIDNPEWDPVTGAIIDNPDGDDAASTSTRIGTCTGAGSAPDGSGCQVRYSGVINYINRFGQINTGMATL